MTKPWKNPVKNVPAKDSTMTTPGDFREFTELMKRVVQKQEEKPKPVSSSRASASS
jgi:hypothetical protein